MQNRRKALQNNGIITRAEARERGLTRYFTGAACSRGHTDERQTSNATCIACGLLSGIEERRERCRRRYHANKAKAAQKCRAYYLENRPYMLERAKRYREEHPDRVSFNNSRRYALRRGAEGDYGPDDIDKIRRQQRGRCAVCRNKMAAEIESIDHITPLSKGGTNWPKNLQLVCRPCNSRKHDKDPIEFMQQNGLLL